MSAASSSDMEKADKEIPSRAVIGVLAVQGDFQAHSNALARLGVPSRLVKKPSDLEGIAGLILPGGESTTFLKFLQEEGLWEAIRTFAESHPVFGTCAGAILMAETVENPPQASLGLMQMTVRRNAYGRQLASSVQIAELEPELQTAPEVCAPLEVVLIRAPLIVEVGAEVKTLARLNGNPILVRQGRWLASTFHPELTNDTRVHRYFCQIVSANSLQIGR